MPRFSDYITNCIVIKADLVEQECMNLAPINLSALVQNFFVSEDVNNFPENTQTIGLFLHLYNLALERQREFPDQWGIYTIIGMLLTICGVWLCSRTIE